jgi:2-(1,2-epoxy-1,2-dihydrophenyl)acetyl-CoA isomerase
MQTFQNITIEQIEDGRIAVLYFNRPEAMNAITPGLAEDLTAALQELDNDPDVRALIISGKGKAFSVGGDLAGFRMAENPVRSVHDLAAQVHMSVRLIRKLNAPVIAAVNGACSGAALSLACCSDFRIASAGARFCFGFVGIGLSADSALPFYLPKIVGPGKAAEMAMLNTVLSAQEALEIKLVDKVTETAQLMDEAASLAGKLAAMPTAAIGRIRRLYDCAFSDSLEAHLNKELDLVTETAATADFKEGCDAFFEKRKPEFKGR